MAQLEVLNCPNEARLLRALAHRKQGDSVFFVVRPNVASSSRRRWFHIDALECETDFVENIWRVKVRPTSGGKQLQGTLCTDNRRGLLEPLGALSHLPLSLLGLDRDTEFTLRRAGINSIEALAAEREFTICHALLQDDLAIAMCMDSDLVSKAVRRFVQIRERVWALNYSFADGPRKASELEGAF
jgi:hypothetical protein